MEEREGSGTTGSDTPGGLEILADRCVHGLMAAASCQACVQACPAGAWRLDGQGLELDRQACDQCGLCLPACPRQAIRWSRAQSRALVRRPFAGGEAVLAGCERAGLDTRTEAEVACLHGIGLHDLLRAYRQGVRVWLVVSGVCGKCDRGGGERLADRVAHVNKALGQRGRPSIVLREVSPAAWRAVLKQGEAPGRRRAFFRQFARQPLAGLISAPANPMEDRDPSLGDLPPGCLMPAGEDADLPWVVDLNPAACSACHVCARICPDQAIALEPDNGAYRLDHARCTGCGLCADVCTSHAVAPRAWAAPRLRRIPLTRHVCPVCGVACASTASEKTAARTVPDTPAMPMCGVCASNQARKRLYQVMAE